MRENTCRKYSPLGSSYSQADPEKADSQLFGSAPGVPPVMPSRGGRHQYQSRLAASADDRESTNQGCSSEVWFTTRSITSFRPRSCIAAISASRSSSEPNSGSTSW